MAGTGPAPTHHIKQTQLDEPQEKEVENYQLRVVIEKAELEIKINDLRSFVDSNPLFDDLSDGEKDALQHQHDCMVRYFAALQTKVNLF